MDHNTRDYIKDLLTNPERLFNDRRATEPASLEDLRFSAMALQAYPGPDPIRNYRLTAIRTTEKRADHDRETDAEGTARGGKRLRVDASRYGPGSDLPQLYLQLGRK